MPVVLTDSAINFPDNSTQASALPAPGSSGNLLISNGSGWTSGTPSQLTVSGNISDSKGEIRTIPVNNQSTAYTLVASDFGKFVSISAGGVTVPAGIFTAGQAVTIWNNSGNNQTITQGSGVTLYQGSDGATGARTLGQRGIATILCVAGNTFVISGAGLT